METTNPAYAMARKDELIADMRLLKEEAGLQAIFFSIIDIIAEKNITFAISDLEKEALKASFGVDTTNNIADLGGRLSRKKELEPALRMYFEKN
jgi:manganese-dependent inorganic pyrophosphatase